MTLAAAMKTDAALVLSTSDMAEEVVFSPRAGKSRTIKALVERGDSDGELAVFIQKTTDLTLGVPLIDIGGDKICVSDRLGERARDFLIGTVIDRDDTGLWHIVLRQGRG
jgi:hypothetical protein